MKYKTAVRLALKLLGVFLIASAIAEFINTAVWLLYSLWDPNVPPRWYYLGSCVGPIAKVLIGLYLFFSGGWIVDLAIPSNRPYCHECAYELTGLPREGICPECGTAYRYAGTDDTRERA